MPAEGVLTAVPFVFIWIFTLAGAQADHDPGVRGACRFVSYLSIFIVGAIVGATLLWRLRVS